MPSPAVFLHVTDTHLSDVGTELPHDDQKVRIDTIPQETREQTVERLFERLAERLQAEGRELDGVIFSGDAQDRGKPGGHQILLTMLLKHFGPFGITPDKIVAVPGNHDIPMRTGPSTADRYRPFLDVWRKAGCVTPWIDGVDPASGSMGPHRLTAADNSWAIYAINSCNWSHTRIDLPEPLASTWDRLAGLTGKTGDELAQLHAQLEKLRVYDMARVSPAQLEALRGIIRATPKPALGLQVRIGVLHHHLHAPSQREELKPFAEISNLEQLRAFLRAEAVNLVIHGHKHEHAANFDHIYGGEGEVPHRTLIISGATLEPGHESDVARLITLRGGTLKPEVEIEALAAPRGGQTADRSMPITRQLWTGGSATDSPTTVSGTDLDTVYVRALDAASTVASGKSLIVHLDLSTTDGGRLPPPVDYPFPEAIQSDAQVAWFQELVAWWQLERSQLEHRVPYLHGTRIRKYAGNINQLTRVAKILKVKPSTRALAVLVDPVRDFTLDGAGEEFASFCLVEFKRRDVGRTTHFIDAVAFYRAQEFARWWPINVAELRDLQISICKQIGGMGFRPGLITTVTADARNYARTPTQVAMPVIDRWLDQAPQMHFLLANALAHGKQDSDASRRAIAAWRQTLAELREAAKEFVPDGGPVAVDGLVQLAAYLRAADVQDDETMGLVRAVERLARTNKIYSEGESQDRFDGWAAEVNDIIEELLALTDRKVGTAKSGSH